ncbi:hypothetical protein KBA41_12925 [Candidatus Ozemobacteraceae bacterium]|nr:hypothetical protein [Candidatus Ozemobacteraceae bacterium]
MKSVRRFVFWSILCCIAVFVVTAAMPACAANVPAARLEGDAIEPEVTESSPTPVSELPKMDFAPADVEERTAPVIEEAAPVTVREEPRAVVEDKNLKADDRRTGRKPKISGRIRDYWLKIHGESATVSGEADERVISSAPVTETPKEVPASAVELRREATIVRQIPVEQKPVVEKTEPVVEETAPSVEEAKPAVEEKPVVAHEASVSAVETAPVAEVSETVKEEPLPAGNRKLSDKVRECWLKIHAQEEPVQIAATKPQDVVPTEPAKSQIIRQTPAQETSETPAMKKEPPAVEPTVEIATAKPVAPEDAKEGTFAPAPTVTSPPLTEAPLVFQKKSAKLALFSGPLAKMAQRREYRLAEAKRLNIVLPSQGGSFDKLPQSIARLKATVGEILTRNGASLVLSMIFKGHFAGGSTNQKRTIR